MKILFLHLSDLHIKSDNAYCEFQIKKIIDSLRTAGSFDRLLFVLSGDIAFSGDKSQYNVAFSLIYDYKSVCFYTQKHRRLPDGVSARIF